MRSFALSMAPFSVLAIVLLIPVLPADAQDQSADSEERITRQRATLELRTTSSTTVATTYFTSDTARESLVDTASGAWWALSHGLELAYRFSPQVSARVAWMPGFTFPSRYSGDENRRRNGAANLRLEAPVVLFGPAEGGVSADGREGGEDGLAGGDRIDGVIGSAPFTLTAAPVGVVKIRGYDLEAQADRRQAGETYNAEHPDIKAHAAGFALSQTAAAGAGVTVRGEQELLFYFPADYKEQSLAYFDTNLVRAGIPDTEEYETIYYRYRLAGSLGATWTAQELPRTQWALSLDVGGWYMPAPIVDDILVADTDRFLLSAEPAVSVAPAAWNGRTRLELSWGIPLWGKNEDARHEVTFGVRAAIF
ncbi:MAG: hypothetical protein ACOCXE_02080 [Spirochaetota bacterium]